MEFHLHHHGHHGFLEDILDSNIAFGINDINDQFDQNALLATPTTFLENSPLSITSQTSSSFEDFSLPFIFEPQTLNCPSFGQHFINPNFVDHDQLYHEHHMSTPNIKLESSPFFNEDYYSMFSSMLADDVQNCHFVDDVTNRVNPEMPDPQGRVTGDQLESERPTGGFNMGKNGKVGGQPSKNLMAERRRRKRLNERLSMLRSVVPKISKMDRTSILADTIDYIKELNHKINEMQMQQQMVDSSSSNDDDLSLMSTKSKEIGLYIRNSPKFEVERRKSGGDSAVRVEVCCRGKPELLISTMTTLQALGLEIHQCVISCFNDFAMHASCSTLQEMEEEERVVKVNNWEDMIKQALFSNAGYGGNSTTTTAV